MESINIIICFLLIIINNLIGINGSTDVNCYCVKECSNYLTNCSKSPDYCKFLLTGKTNDLSYDECVACPAVFCHSHAKCCFPVYFSWTCINGQCIKIPSLEFDRLSLHVIAKIIIGVSATLFIIIYFILLWKYIKRLHCFCYRNNANVQVPVISNSPLKDIQNDLPPNYEVICQELNELPNYEEALKKFKDFEDSLDTSQQQKENMNESEASKSTSVPLNADSLLNIFKTDTSAWKQTSCLQQQNIDRNSLKHLKNKTTNAKKPINSYNATNLDHISSLSSQVLDNNDKQERKTELEDFSYVVEFQNTSGFSGESEVDRYLTLAQNRPCTSSEERHFTYQNEAPKESFKMSKEFGSESSERQLHLLKIGNTESRVDIWCGNKYI